MKGYPMKDNITRVRVAFSETEPERFTVSYREGRDQVTRWAGESIFYVNGVQMKGTGVTLRYRGDPLLGEAGDEPVGWKEAE
jgi:hypothetical protein